MRWTIPEKRQVGSLGSAQERLVGWRDVNGALSLTRLLGGDAIPDWNCDETLDQSVWGCKYMYSTVQGRGMRCRMPARSDE